MNRYRFLIANLVLVLVLASGCSTGAGLAAYDRNFWGAPYAFSKAPTDSRSNYMIGQGTPYVAATTTDPHSLDDSRVYIGNLSANPYAPNSTSNPYSSAGSPYAHTSPNNPYGLYGSPYSAKSVTNPYALDTPRLYDSSGNYRGKLSSNPYDPESISNPYGQYGNPYSSDSIWNPYGAGNSYSSDSPWNTYGSGLRIYGSE